MKEIKRLSAVIITVVFFVAYFILCNIFAGDIRHNASDIIKVDKNGNDVISSSVTGASFESSLKKYAALNMENEVRIGAVGDIMCYSYQLDYAYNASTGTYDFNKSFSDIASYLRNTDLLIGNLETTVAGQQQSSISISNGYMGDASTMLFNTPEAMLQALKSAGFTTLTTANEQAFDYGIDGLKSTIGYLENNNLAHTGTVAETGDTKYIIQRVKGLNVGVIAYTNAKEDSFSADNIPYINYLNDYSEEAVNAMCSHIKEMKLEGADIIVAALHYGDTYASFPNDQQIALSRKLCDAGVDIIVGSHPHVVEPFELYSATQSDGSQKKCLILYSLGNFLTSQQYQMENGYNRDLGCAVFMNIKKKDSQAYIESFDMIPTYSDWTNDNIRVIPITAAKDNAEIFSGQFDYLDDDRIESGYTAVINTFDNMMGMNYTYDNYMYHFELGN